MSSKMNETGKMPVLTNKSYFMSHCKKQSFDVIVRRSHYAELIELAEDKKEVCEKWKNYCAEKYGTDSFLYNVYSNKLTSVIGAIQKLNHSLLKISL